MTNDDATPAPRAGSAPNAPDPVRWARIVELFHAALERPASQRDAFLRDVCGDDAALRVQVESLLTADAQADGVGLEDLAARAAVAWAEHVAGPALIGRRLGRYTIVARLGSGGMGDVYGATDDALGRRVALKVLRSRLLAEPGWRGRLEREARAASALNHPNIVTVYEIGRDEELDFIASELVEGETLGARLRRGALPARDLIDIGVQIAAALSAAHTGGLVHRDIKPDNVMLRPDGLVKVVDFGLAMLTVPRDEHSQMTAEATRARTMGVAGTLAYMSPEQALGERLDARTDLFSLGVVLYEMAAGRRPFDGDSEAAHYDALLHGSPPAPSTLTPKLPPALDLVIGRALEKDRDLRYQSAADLASDLKRLQRPSLSAGRPALMWRRRSRWPWQVATLVALIASGVLAAQLWMGRAPTAAIDARFTVNAPPGTELTLSGTIVPSMTLTIAPDGRQLVFLAGPHGDAPRLWMRPLASLEAVPLTGTEGASYPFWSPDGQSLGFFADGALKRIELRGGAIRTLAVGLDGRGGTWGPDGTILFGSAEGPIFRVAAAGGTPSPVTTLDRTQGEVWHRFPQWLPEGRRFLYLVRAGQGRRALYAASVAASGGVDASVQTRKLFDTEVRAAFASGSLLYVSEQALMSRPFDPIGLRWTGEPIQVTPTVATSSAQDAAFAVSAAGTLAYVPRTRAPGRLTWLDRAGRTVAVVGDVQDYLGLRRSPDGRTIALTRVDASRNTPDLWLLDVARGVSSRFTFDPWNDVSPAWSPDGTSIVFASSRPGRFLLFRRAAAGGPEETPLVQTDVSKYPDDWSPDGRLLIFSTDPRPGAYDLAMLRVADGRVMPLVATRFNESQGRLSPDGRWLAYTSDETGRAEVHLRRFPDGASHVQLSNDGGSEPLWRGDGRELFYLAEDGRLMAVAMRITDATVEAGPPRVLFQTSVSHHAVPYVTRYAATADGQRFLFTVPVGSPVPAAITVMLDWTAASRSKP